MKIIPKKQEFSKFTDLLPGDAFRCPAVAGDDLLIALSTELYCSFKEKQKLKVNAIVCADGSPVFITTEKVVPIPGTFVEE